MPFVHDHDLMFFFFFLFLVARCQSDSDDAVDTIEESNDIGIVGDDTQDFGDGTFSSAPGIDTISVFPKNSARCKNHTAQCTKQNVVHNSFYV